jgi:hypothetical protein
MVAGRLAFLASLSCWLCCLSPLFAQQPEDAAGPFRISIEKRIGLPCGDCDGIALGDINGNGKIDILASNGKGVTTFWFEQGETPWEWSRHPIFTAPGEGIEFEGNDLGDFNGDGRLEAVSLEQRGGTVYLHAPVDDPRGEWRTVALVTDRPYLQSSLVTDVDGDGRVDLIYAWEGNAEGTGGVHWLKFTGEDLLDPEHWTDHVMVTHESAWWFAPRRIDISGNGRETDLIFTARNIPGRNPGTRPGVYWLEEPEDVTGPWKRHLIDDSLKHPLHCDLGNLSGAGHGQDLIVGGFDTDTLVWYEFGRDWQRHELVVEQVHGGRPNRIWNVKCIPAPRSDDGTPAGRDAILSPVTSGNRGSLLMFEFIDGRYQPNELFSFDYGHPMDDRILLHDLDGDGRLEAFIPDSGPRVDQLWIVKFRR